ncbi:MAG: serine hydrolase [Gammaproteobacteria bacterium]
MSIDIIGAVDANRLYCAGSFTKLLTTYVSLSLLAEKYNLAEIIDDDNFFDMICVNPKSKEFLAIFQKIIGNKFSLHDICSYYAGLPYTFDLSDDELKSVEAGNPFKHHSIPDEDTFLDFCRTKITPVYTNRCKFHYSEISILFLGYLIEQIYDVKMEELYRKYILDKFELKNSYFSRKKIANVYSQDISDKYDYPSVAILDHGYFCYSNGYYTNLNDMKTLIENFLIAPVFQFMVDPKYARAASGKLMNGITIELRMVKDDILYGYEGLSYSGCNIWAYSTKYNQGYVTFNDSEEDAYTAIYDKFGYTTFDKAPDATQIVYLNFLKNYRAKIEEKDFPLEYQGNYHRVKINDKTLEDTFSIGKNAIVIRNPDEIKYPVVFVNNTYRIKGKDNVHGAKVGLYQANSGNKYMLYDGTLYKKIM